MSNGKTGTGSQIEALEARLPDDRDRMIEPARDNGRPRTLHSMRLGQLSVLVAFGFSHREAATWLNCGHATVSRYVTEDDQLRDMIEHFRKLAQIHPLTRLFRAQKTSWRASCWLLDYFDKRGAASTQDARDAFAELVAKVNSLIMADDFLPPDEEE